MFHVIGMHEVVCNRTIAKMSTLTHTEPEILTCTKTNLHIHVQHSPSVQ